MDISILNKIEKTIGQCKYESGGVIGSQNQIITHYQFDSGVDCDEYEYTPDVKKINEILLKWSKNNIRFEGLIHSHKTNNDLSYADVEYARKILELNNIKYVFMFVFVLDVKDIFAYKITSKEICFENIEWVDK